jgi:signal transduction histidine kinase
MTPDQIKAGLAAAVAFVICYGGVLLASGAVPDLAWNELLYLVVLPLTAGSLGALAVVLLASRRSNERIGEIKKALADFAAGDQKRRANFPGAVDSLYELAFAVNCNLDLTETLSQNLDHLSADIAHNLKKPLIRLRNRLEAAGREPEIRPHFKSQIDDSVRELDELTALFEALLNITQFQAGHGRSRFRDVDLRALVLQIIATFEPIIADSRMKLISSVPRESVPQVRGDPGLIMEMLVNLVENAIQHCPEGTTISIELASDSHYVTLVIADTGPGIPEQALASVFQRFYRLDTSRPGHGIGMAFAVSVAELHGATFELLDNQPGLKISLQFPIDPGALAPQLGLRMRSGLKVPGIDRR